MNITMIGAGYVGLVTGACFSNANHQVVIYDINQDLIEQLKQGKLTIHEPELDKIVHKVLQSGLLRFTNDRQTAMDSAEVVFIAVGTPSNADGSVSLQAVHQVAEMIGDTIDSDTLVVIKSTVPIGTSEQVSNIIHQKIIKRKLDIQVFMASNPEFLKQGQAVADFLNPDRVVIGAETKRTEDVLKNLYLPFLNQHDDLLIMNIREAEFSKYAANAMLATKISFINEMASLSAALGIDIKPIQQTLKMDKRIGPHFIDPGCGYGGSCLPKDVKGLISIAKQSNIHASLLEAVDYVNTKQRFILFQFAVQYFESCLSNKVVAIWGLAFKPHTDDVRESPSIQIIEKFCHSGAMVRAYDPKAMAKAWHKYSHLSNLEFMPTKEACLQQADALVICTDWDEFKEVPLHVLVKHLKNEVIFDGRNIFNGDILEQNHIHYYGIGCGRSSNQNVRNSAQI